MVWGIIFIGHSGEIDVFNLAHLNSPMSHSRTTRVSDDKRFTGRDTYSDSTSIKRGNKNG
jgi:hypothetical protein